MERKSVMCTVVPLGSAYNRQFISKSTLTPWYQDSINEWRSLICSQHYWNTSHTMISLNKFMISTRQKWEWVEWYINIYVSHHGVGRHTDLVLCVCQSICLDVSATPQKPLARFPPNFTGVISGRSSCAYHQDVPHQWFLAELRPLMCWIFNIKVCECNSSDTGWLILTNFTGVISARSSCAYYQHVPLQWFLGELQPFMCWIFPY